MIGQTSPRRDVVYFLLGPAALCVLCALLWRVHPWPVAVPAQTVAFGWPILIPVLVAGAIGVGLSSRVGCPSAPPLADGRDWAGLLAISCGVGFAAGLYQLFQSVWPPFAHQVEILDRQSGMPALAAWVNVGLPWSIPHYFVGSVGLEILYRLAPIPILTWLISNLALRGRGQAATFWSVGVLAAFLEPLTSLLITVRGPLPAATLAFELFDAAMTLAFNLLEVVGFRRYGWPATIAYRVALYAALRVFVPYLLSPHSVSYPGPH